MTITMSRLTAIYEVEISRGLRVKRAESEELNYQTRTGDFDVGVVLLCNGGGSFKAKNDQHATRLIEKIRLRVMRDEESEPPPILVNEAGSRDLGEQAQWFSEREGEYKHAALTILNRLIRFFKFRMKSPYLHEFVGHEECFKNPIWKDENGGSLDSGILELSARVISPPGPRLLSERDFTAEDDSNLEECLAADMEPETFEEFLADAQTSILSGKRRRAILEMAIACEVAVKQLFFGEGTIAPSVFGYLEDKRRIRVKVIEFLDGAAKHTFGKSFKEANPTAFQDIDLLFRCRNKVAHKGELTYRHDSGIQDSVNQETLERWWASTEELMVWIRNAKTAAQGELEAE